MKRRDFLQQTGIAAAAAFVGSAFRIPGTQPANPGIQLYTVRKEMLEDAKGTLKTLAALGIKQIESAGSDKGAYYGLKPAEMRTICFDLGMVLRSGHVHLDDKWQQTMEDAVAAKQEYLICSSLPVQGQTIDNYQKTAAAFNKAGEACNKVNLKFGYHNHDYEFDLDLGTVLYDILLKETDPGLVCTELDLGWVVASGHDPVAYFDRFPGRFPLWHLKDMDLTKKHSVEFGKGGLPIQKMFDNRQKSGLKYYFIEQEEYSMTPLESMKMNLKYLESVRI